MTIICSRRGALVGVSGIVVSACSRSAPAKKAPVPGAPASPPAPEGSIAWAVNGPWRTPEDRQRDQGVHPAETLTFFGLAPAMTVVELWPGSGFWTEIVGPYLKANAGRLVAATFETPNPQDPAAASVVADYRKMLSERPNLYGATDVTTFGPKSGPLAAKGAADLVLFFHLDHWMAAGLAEKAFHDAFEALKPKGVLGLLQARAGPGGAQDALAANGLVQEAFVRQMAEEAGFTVKAMSEVNARRGAGAGGEPDRMTITFVKKTP